MFAYVLSSYSATRLRRRLRRRGCPDQPPRRAPTAPPSTCAPPPTEPSARWAISKAISEEKVWGAHFNGGSSGSRRTPSDHRATKYDHNIAAAGRFLPILGFSSPQFLSLSRSRQELIRFRVIPSMAFASDRWDAYKTRNRTNRPHI